MSTTTDIKFEFYIDSTSDQDTSTSLSPADATDLGLNAGVVVDQLGGGITFSNAGSIKGGKTAWDVGIGFWLGYQNQNYRVAIGDPANEKVTWDGDDLVIDIDLSNLTINGGSSGQVLSTDGNGSLSFTDIVFPSMNLNDLADVTLSSLAQNNILQYNGTNWVNATGDIFPYSLTGSGGTGGGGASPKVSLLNGNSAVKGEITFTEGNNMTITRSGNNLTFASTVSPTPSLWTQTGNDIYYNSGNVAIGTSSPHSTHPLKIMGTLFSQGTSSSPGLNGIILDSRTTGGNSNQWWQLVQEPGGDLHLTRNANAANALKVGRSTGTFMIPAGVCLNGTVTYDSSNVLDDYEEGTISGGSMTISNSSSGGTTQSGTTHLDGNYLRTLEYVKVGNVVHISFAFRINNTQNLTTTSPIYLSLPFAATGVIHTGPVNVLNAPSSGSSNYNARLEHAYSFISVGTSRMGFAYNISGSTATLFTLAELFDVNMRGSITYLTS